jgi:hypothetical protein
MATFDEVQKAEVSRTVDKAPASRTRAIANAVKKNQKVANEAADVDQSLDIIITASNNDLNIHGASIKRLWEYAGVGKPSIS